MEGKSKQSYVLSGKNWQLDLSTPCVMGILNITPDSFFDGGKYESISQATQHAINMVEQGAGIIDIGGQSTRPNSIRVGQQEELDRIAQTVEAIVNYNRNIIISIDTYNSYVAKQAIALGAHIINDISGGNMDNAMLETVAHMQVPYITMHMQGTPNTMQINPTYNNVVAEVYNSLEEKINEAKITGINCLIADPGIGFGKTTEQNYMLIKNIKVFKNLQVPLLVGISRKSFISKSLQIEKEHTLNATSALHLNLLQNGVSILRVHDVAEANQMIAVYKNLIGEIFSFTNQKIKK